MPSAMKDHEKSIGESLKDESSLVSTIASLNKTELQESIELLTKAQMEQLWIHLDNHSSSLMSRIEKHAYQSEHSQSMDVEVAVLLKIVACAEINIKQKNAIQCTHLEKTVSKAASLLLFPDSLTSNLRDAKITVSRFIESWWSDNNSSAIAAMVYLIPFLLMECLRPNVKLADFKRLWNIRGGFLLLDYRSESSLLIRELVMDSLVCPAFAASPVGEKLLAYFLVHENGFFLSTGLKLINQFISRFSLASSSTYGKVFHSVWKELSQEASNEPLVLKIEESHQNWVYQAMHASNAKTFKSLRALILAFHSTNRNGALHSMLKRIYGPILWRSVKCANAIVRAQATILFFDVFPLHDPEGSAEEDDSLLQRQFDLLTSLLNDSDHTVRLNAVNGTCQILIDYWESLPLDTTNNILRHLILKLSTDSASSAVRASVFQSLERLLKQQPLSHAVLKTLIPLTKNALHDSSEKVRLAFVKLLIQVSSTRAMHFYEVCDLDAILDQMVLDKERPLLSLHFTQLLEHSFFPSSTSAGGSAGPAQITRCIKFIEMNESAALVFYSNLYRVVENVGRVVKFSAILSTIAFESSTSSGSSNAAGGEKKAASGKATKRSRPQAADTEEVSAAANVSVDEDTRQSLLYVVMVLLSSLKALTQDDLTPDSLALLTKYFTGGKLSLLMQSAVESGVDAEVALSIVGSLLFLVSKHSEDENAAVKAAYSSLLEFDAVNLLNGLNEQEEVDTTATASVVSLMLQLGQEDQLSKWLVREFKQIKQSVDKKGLEGALATTLTLPATVFSLYVSSLSAACGASEKKLPAHGFSGFAELLQLVQSLFTSVALTAAPSTEGQEVVSLLLLALSACTTVVAQQSSPAHLEKLLDWMSKTIHTFLKPNKAMSIGAIGLLNLSFAFLTDLVYLSVAPTVLASVAAEWINDVSSYVDTLSDSTAVDVKAWLSAVSPVLCKLAMTLSGIDAVTFADSLKKLLASLTDAMSEAGLDGTSAVCLEVNKCANFVNKATLIEA